MANENKKPESVNQSQNEQKKSEYFFGGIEVLFSGTEQSDDEKEKDIFIYACGN